MSSKSDSLHDIFGPTGSDSTGPDKLVQGQNLQPTATPNSANKVDDFDEIFGESNSAKDGGIAKAPGGEQQSGDSRKDISPTSAIPAVDQTSSLGPDDFDNIFASTSSNAGTGVGSGDRSSSELARTEAAESSSPGHDGVVPAAEIDKVSTGPQASVAGRGTSSDGDKAFLDFLYDGDKGNPGSSSGNATPTATLGDDLSSSIVTEPTNGDGAMALHAGGSMKQSDEIYCPSSRCLRDRAILRPLPANPASALRELVDSGESTQIEESVEQISNKEGDEKAVADAGDTEVKMATAAVEDVGYVRRLCAAAGGFLPRDLRPAVWSLLLGLGTTTPDDSAFRKWREDQDQPKSSLETDAPSKPAPSALIQNKIDLHNDSLALARRLCTGGDAVLPAVDGSTPSGLGAGRGDSGADPEALAAEIEQVLTFYCARRSEAYEPGLSALVGPLFSLGLDAAAVSAMLYPLVGALTLFLGRGLTLAVRDLAWAHAHRRLHDLCTYHDPELVQHLDRCFSGWEMPLPAASVSRAETSARDQEAAAMVDDLESSLGSSLARRRQSAARPSPEEAFASEQEDGDAGDDGESETSRDEIQEDSATGKQGVVEPSLLVAACSGLGAAVPLRDLVSLWDILLVRRDKHFGFFLILAALLQRRDDLLAATGPQLRRLLSEILSPEGLASVGVRVHRDGDKDNGAENDVHEGKSSEGEGDEGGGVAGKGEGDGKGDADGEGDGQSTDSKGKLSLVAWCEEAEALDLATPESFRHHLALIGEIAEAEHEAAMRSRGRSERNEPPGASPSGSSVVTAGSTVVSNRAGSVLTTSPRSGAGVESSGASSAKDSSSGVASSEGKESAGVAGTSRGQGEDDSKVATLGTSSSSFGRMRYMMKSAGDRIAADFKSLTLTRTASGSRAAPSSEVLAPPLELSLPQLCLAVSAKELLLRISGGQVHEVREEAADVDGGSDEKATTLFRERRPLSFFAIDCRPKEQVEAGRLPKAYHMDPSAMENPEDIAEPTAAESLQASRARPRRHQRGYIIRALILRPLVGDLRRVGHQRRFTRIQTVMSVFEPLKGTTHLCLMGTGDGYMRSRGTGVDQGEGLPSARGDDPGVGSTKAARDDYSYVNTCALFFIKRGFPYVSVLEGGYAAVHELVMDALSRNPTSDVASMKLGGEVTTVSAAGPGDFALITAIVDYNPAKCRLSLAKSASSTPPGSSSNRNNSYKGSDNSTSNIFGNVNVAGMSFPVPSPLWAHLGAADTPGQGLDVVTDASQRSRRGTEQRSPSSVGDRVTNVFFPPQRERPRSRPRPRPQQGAAPSEAGSEDGLSSGATAPGKAEGSGATEAGGSTASLFKTSAVFRGMTVNNLFKSSVPSRDSEPRKDPAARVGAGQEAKAVPDADPDSSSAPATTTKTQPPTDLTSKIRMSFGRFSSPAREAKRDVGEGDDGAGAGQDGVTRESSRKDSGFGSIFRKAQAFKPADVAAAFTDLRDGPKTVSRVSSTPSSEPQTKASLPPQPQRDADEDEEDDGEGLFVIGDDGSESSEAPDSDFEGFDGEQRPPSSGGARSEADKALALLEHRLSGQVKGGTMVVEEFLKVPGAKMFTVTKYKVTYHDVDAAPPGDSSFSGTTDDPSSEDQSPSPDGGLKSQEKDANETGKSEGDEGTKASSSTEGKEDVSGGSKKESVRVRAVMELERLIFLSRERILVVACPEGPRSPGLVKSNHHLTELQKMTFLRRDPTLVTLHYLALEGPTDQAVATSGAVESPLSPKTKRNEYRFAMEDKETFIRLIRGALQRFQT